MQKKKKSFYFGAKLVKKLSGISFYRLSVYSKNKQLDVVGYLDAKTNILFVDFSLLYFYIYKGFNFISFKGLIGHNLRELNLSGILLMGLFNWIFHSKTNNRIIMPKRFWLKQINRILYIVYYLVFRNIVIFKNLKFKVLFNLSKILAKRYLIVRKLNLVEN